MAYHAIGIAVFLPLLGFLLNGLFGWKIKNERISGIIGSSTVGIAFLIAATTFVQMLGAPAEERAQFVMLIPWIHAGALSVNIGYQVDHA